MKDSQLQKMSYKELIQLQRRVAGALEKKRGVERAALRQKLKTMAEQAGFQIDDLFGQSRERAANSGIKVKYRHPTDRSLIWTGRGRRPKWLLAEGGDVERFRVA